MAVSYKPDGYSAVTPYLKLRGAAKAIEWYKDVFGAQATMTMPMPDGRLMHAELVIDGAPIMMSDEFPEWGSVAPEADKPQGSSVHLYVKDVDSLFKKAVAAGAKGPMPPMDMFWGDRFVKLTDPFGHEWSLATHIEDVSPEETAKRQQEWMKEMAASPNQK